MRKLAQEDCGFEEPTVAMAFVYFEKLALKGKLNKQNRKLCAGACVLLAAKIGSDLKKHEVKHLIDVSSPCPDGWACTRSSPVLSSQPLKPLYDKSSVTCRASIRRIGSTDLGFLPPWLPPLWGNVWV